MSPEFERLLQAFYERDHCEPNQRGRCERNVCRLINDALQRMPGVSYDHVLDPAPAGPMLKITLS